MHYGHRPRIHPVLDIMVGSPARRKLFLIYCFAVLCITFYVWYTWSGGGRGGLLQLRHPKRFSSDVNLNVYFEAATDDGYQVSWATHLNSVEKLDEALNSNSMMMEGDVVFRHQGTSKQQMTPIMSLPPKTNSDITFNEWVEKVITASLKKGIKLNYRSIEPVEISLQLLKSVEAELHFPVWLCADILLGPNCECHKKGNQPKPRWDLPIDATRFLRLVTTMLPQSTLCLGWTSHFDKDRDEGSYTWPMVLEMYNHVKKWNTHKQPLVFSIRAPLIRKSIPKIKWLLDMTGAQVLVWADPDDEVESSLILLLQIMRYKFPKANVFFQLPGRIAMRFEEHISDIEDSSLPKDWAEYEARTFNSDQWNIINTPLLGAEAVLVTCTDKSPASIMSKGIYKSTKDYPLHVYGKVTFFTLEQSKGENKPIDSGLEIYIRSSIASSPRYLNGVKCRILTSGHFSIHATTKSGKELKKEGQLSLINTCLRFDVVDEMETLYFKVSTLPDCDDSIGTQVHEKSNLILDISQEDVENKNSRIYIKTTGSGGNLAIDELRVK